jgi:hypothetical protein
MLYEFSASVDSKVVLFEDHVVTKYVIPGAVVRRGAQEIWTYKPREKSANICSNSAEDYRRQGRNESVRLPADRTA